MLVICPSRGRPGNIVELLDCWASTTTAARLVVCVDDDDPTLGEYRQILPTADHALFVGARKSLCGWINHAALVMCDLHDVLGFIGDDVRPRTPRWDSLVADAMRPLGVVYGNDLHQGAALPTHPFFDSAFVKAWGWACPPSIDHLYIDNFWQRVGQHFDTLTYLGDVVLEHMHPHAGKAEMDDGYRAVNSRDAYKRGRKAFIRYMADAFDADMGRLPWTSSSPAS